MCVRSCSTAPALERDPRGRTVCRPSERATATYLKVSQAAMSTRHLFSTSQKQILARLVDLPTPLTPQNVMTYGLLLFLASRTSLMMSILRFGVSSLSKDSTKVSLTVR